MNACMSKEISKTSLKREELLSELKSIIAELEMSCEPDIQRMDDGNPEYRRFSGKTYAEQVDDYLEEKKSLLSTGTITNYRRILKRAGIIFDDYFIQDIGCTELKEYFRKLSTAGKNSYTGKKLKVGTIRQSYIALHAFFTNAFDNGVIPDNPMKRIKRPHAGKDEEMKEIISYDEKEVRSILACLNKEPIKWKALMMVALDSGCRCGELMGLRWTDIDFTTGRMVIVRNIQYNTKKGLFVCTPKNGKGREVYLNEPVVQIFKEWKNEQDKNMLIKRINTDGYCFTARKGTPMMPGCFNSYLRHFGKKYGFNGIHPHALRHTMASISIANGADIVSVSKKLGHSKVSITLDIYSHANTEAQRRANAVFANAVYV